MRKFECPECGETLSNGKSQCEPCGRTSLQVQCAACNAWNDISDSDQCRACGNPLKDVLVLLWPGSNAHQGDLVDDKYLVIGEEPYGLVVADNNPNMAKLFFSPHTVLEKAYREMGYFRDQARSGKDLHMVVEAPFSSRREPLPLLKKVWDQRGNFDKIRLLRELFSGGEKLFSLGVARTLFSGEIYVRNTSLLFFPLHADQGPAEEKSLIEELEAFVQESFGKDDFVLSKLYGEGRLESFEAVLEKLDEIKERFEARFFLESYGTTDLGPVRENNEDNFFAVEFRFFHPDDLALGGRNLKQRGLYIICDGMGGHQKGEVASALVVKELKRKLMPFLTEELPPPGFEHELKQIIKDANDMVLEVNIVEGIPANEGRMGTTLVALIAFENEAFIVHVGDSRCYKYERGEVALLTEDHNLSNQALHAGTFKTREEAERMRGGKVLTQAMGPREGLHLVPEVRRELIRGDCCMLLCSDGLSDVVKDSDIKEIIESGGGNLRRMTGRLIRRAYRNMTRDNITALLVKFSHRS